MKEPDYLFPLPVPPKDPDADPDEKGETEANDGTPGSVPDEEPE